MTSHPSEPPTTASTHDTSRTDGDAQHEDVDRVRGFALTEDWLATLAGLVVVILALTGVITESWLPL